MMRFTIRQLLIATVLAAVAIVALLNASWWWASAAISGVLLSLSASIVLAIYRDGQGRAFWIGFSILGWVYIALLAGGPWISTSSDFPLGQHLLITDQIMQHIYIAATNGYPQIPPAPVDPFAIPGSDPFQPPSGTASPPRTPPRQLIPPLWRNPPESRDFYNVGHALCSLGIAAAGGWFAVWASATRQRAQ